MGQSIPTATPVRSVLPVGAIGAGLELRQEREDSVERGAQAGPPRCGCPQLGQQHGAQLRVLPQEGGQAQPSTGLPSARLRFWPSSRLVRAPAGTGQKAESGPVPLPALGTEPQGLIKHP